MTLNWKAAALPLFGLLFLAYGEIKKDWDGNPNTNSDTTTIVTQGSIALGILLGTTTAKQTADIAQKKIDENPYGGCCSK